MINKIDDFIQKLANFKSLEDTFNPWKDVNLDFDKSDAHIIRQYNLKLYLQYTIKAKKVFIGEAPGFYGCRFCGIPFLDEQTILKYSKEYKQSSNSEIPYQEKTALVLQNHSHLQNNIYKWVTWNIFPFHPYQNGNVQSNRKPIISEINETKEIIDSFLQLFPNVKIYCIGRTSENYFKNKLDMNIIYLRHPSFGGAKLFSEACNNLIF